MEMVDDGYEPGWKITIILIFIWHHKNTTACEIRYLSVSYLKTEWRIVTEIHVKINELQKKKIHKNKCTFTNSIIF